MDRRKREEQELEGYVAGNMEGADEVDFELLHEGQRDRSGKWSKAQQAI